MNRIFREDKLTNYPKNIEEKIGFDQIRNLISKECLSPLGSRMIHSASFSADSLQIKRWHRETSEFTHLNDLGLQFPSDNYIDVTPHFKYLNVEGFFLDEDQLFQIRISLETIIQIIKFLKLHIDKFPTLYSVMEEVSISEELTRRIDTIIDKKGKIKPSASKYLLDIETFRTEIERDLQKRIGVLYRRAAEKGYVAETDITIRDGRYVLPVLAEHKRHVPGFVHDESGGGQLYYIEPSETLELNNRLRELNIERKREVERILKEITQFIYPYRSELQLAYKQLGVIDSIRAKSFFAKKIHATTPILTDKKEIKWRNVFHPLLWLNHHAQKKETIPLNITLNSEQRLLLISGPNAGGKSVALKTVGLLQFMVQTGFPVPAESHSEIGIFDKIFIDIGDEQSIENDLSTYSSHLRNLKHFTIASDKNTLLLIDELGTGTDPHFGGPMAEAFLEVINKSRPYGIITSHFSNLKILAGHTKGMANASMAFDVKNMIPLFRLEMGIPGSSYAFEVAEKIGMPKEVIQRARQKVGSKQKNVDELIIQLEKEQNEVKEKALLLENRQLHYDKLIQEYEQIKKNFENKRADIINSAKLQAAHILEDANRLIEKSVKEIKEKNAVAENIKRVKENIDVQKTKLIKESTPKVEIIEGNDFNPGDNVRIKGQLISGIIISADKKNALVAYGDMKSKIPLEKLEKISRKEAKKVQESFKGYNVNEKMSDFNSNLDLRGLRTENALEKMHDLLEQANVLGFEQLRLIHGKGDGILRKMLREELKKVKFVKSFQDEHIDLGGQGITVVTLK